MALSLFVGKASNTALCQARRNKGVLAKQKMASLFMRKGISYVFVFAPRSFFQLSPLNSTTFSYPFQLKIQLKPEEQQQNVSRKPSVFWRLWPREEVSPYQTLPLLLSKSRQMSRHSHNLPSNSRTLTGHLCIVCRPHRNRHDPGVRSCHSKIRKENRDTESCLEQRKRYAGPSCDDI